MQGMFLLSWWRERGIPFFVGPTSLCIPQYDGGPNTRRAHQHFPPVSWIGKLGNDIAVEKLCGNDQLDFDIENSLRPWMCSHWAIPGASAGWA